MKTPTRHYSETTYVYEAFDAFGNLLYVGITNNLRRRLNEHRLRAKWWSQHTEIRHTVYGSRDEAKDYETQLIQRDSPVFNISETDKAKELLRLSWHKRKQRKELRQEPRFISSTRETVALLSVEQCDEIDELVELLSALKTFRRPPRSSYSWSDDACLDTTLRFARILCRAYGVESQRWAASDE